MSAPSAQAEAVGDLRFVAGWFLLTRAIVSLASVIGAAHRPPGAWSQSLGGPPAPALLAPFVRWDSAYYIDLARNGYPHLPGGALPIGPVYHAAFFPLYPLLVHAVDILLRDTTVAALLVSNVCAFVAALLICRLARASGPGDARAAAALFLASPGAGFLSYPYTEALFCALVAAGLLAVRKGRPWLAAIAGAFASATRPTGAVVSVALVARAWSVRSNRSRAATWLVAAGVGLAGLVAYAAFCRATYSDGLYFSHVQSEWGRHISLLGPWRAFAAFRFDPDYYGVTIVAIAAAVWMVRRAPMELTASAWFLLLVPLSTGTLKSMIRFQGANVPLFSSAGPALPRRALRIVLVVSLLLLAFEAYAYSAGHARN